MKPYQTVISSLLVPSVLLLSGCFDDSHSSAPKEVKQVISSDGEQHIKDSGKIVHKDPRRTLLDVAGLGQIHASAKQIMHTYLQPVLVDFKQASVTEDQAAIEAFHQRQKSHQLTLTSMADGQLFAGMKKRPDQALIYLVKQPQGAIDKVVFPIEGKGYLSQLKGFIALDIHDWHIDNIAFYQQGETPSLGGHIMTDQTWLAQFHGKQIYRQGKPAFKVISKHPASLDDYAIDGISGATNTSNSVQNLINDWMGENGFAPLLEKIQKQAHL